MNGCLPTQAKRVSLERAHAQHIVQIASARDSFLRKLGLAKRGCKKRSHFEVRYVSYTDFFPQLFHYTIAMCKQVARLQSLPTDGLISNGAEWLLVRYDPVAQRLIKSRRLKLNLDPDTASATELGPQVSHNTL